MKNARKILNRWGKLMQIILVKRTLYVTENAQKKTQKFDHLFPGETL